MPPPQKNTLPFRHIYSELESAWLCLEEAIFDLPDSKNKFQLLHLIDQGMSWESVRNVEKMREAITHLYNIIRLDISDPEVHYWINAVRRFFYDIIARLKKGECL